MAETIEVTLYTRHPCALCDKAKAAIDAAASLHRLPVRVKEVDIDADETLCARFTNDVPVIYVDGAEAFRHRVSAEQFAEFVKMRADLAELRDWSVVEAHHLEKEFRFPDFAQALAFTNEVGAIAEELGHHPDIHLGWGRVKIVTWSHDAGGLTARDVRLAQRIDRLRAD
jgi:4a-hydroxytetrahydrobiopterin dehydratase